MRVLLVSASTHLILDVSLSTMVSDLHYSASRSSGGVEPLEVNVTNRLIGKASQLGCIDNLRKIRRIQPPRTILPTR
ncbi:MAG: hypothetical protein HY582_02585 [Candidatus Omnitrophica bacterium]|nr:hypothetical protein [Candidatus Omnitrophota bacterium]